MADKAQLQEAIKTQGEVVRKLKSEKASKEQVSMRSEAFQSLMTEHMVWSTAACYIFHVRKREITTVYVSSAWQAMICFIVFFIYSIVIIQYLMNVILH